MSQCKLITRGVLGVSPPVFEVDCKAIFDVAGQVLLVPTGSTTQDKTTNINLV